MLEVLFLNTFELCAVAEAYNPNMVCIVESWLGDCIFGEEVAIPGYRTHIDWTETGMGVVSLSMFVKLAYIITLSLYHLTEWNFFL